MWRAAPRPVDSAYVCWGGESKAAYGGLCEHLEAGFLAINTSDAPGAYRHCSSPQHKQSVFVIVVQATARMVAGWQALGFCHGVLNTDNFTLLGLALDFGPCRSVPISAWSTMFVFLSNRIARCPSTCDGVTIDNYFRTKEETVTLLVVPRADFKTGNMLVMYCSAVILKYFRSRT